MKRKIMALCLAALLCLANTVNAQQAEKNAEMGEIIRMVTMAQDIPFFSFEFQTLVQDSAGLEPHTDTVTGIYRMSEGRFWALVDEVEYVQGFNYNLAIYHPDQIIAVGKPAVGLPAFQLSLLDSIFQQVHVQSVSISQLAQGTKLFRLNFRGESPYSGYEMRYHPQTYQVYSIVYYMKEAYEREDGSVGTARIVTTFSNYSNSEFSRDYFQEEKYIYKGQNGLAVRPAYSGYQIIQTEEDL